MGRFEDRVAVITGGSRGIGLAIARTLVFEGARVCITGRKQDALDSALDVLGDSALAIAGRVDDADHRRNVIASTTEAFGAVDYLVNNVAVNPAYGRTIDTDREIARKIVDVNALAVIEWTRALVEAGLGAREGAAIVNISSAASRLPSPGIGMYGASKAMLEHLTKQLAYELAPGVRVNAVAPAVIRTDFSTVLYSGREQEVASSYPLKRLGETYDIAEAVAFLLSAQSSWITGQTIVVDGGLTLMGGI